ncbi:hypothetical protein L228DRAFT_150252 [Xylona heveae TC161]|uniref:Uncharacterized protein n=1 Tax=Xylona heveae (strain CBS 132557 / TC161) TaxID=1328760 RepID=A0A165GKK3_XYLHT|nr:hypothetical protein L228DRAFT_150252 [Xylona heveae TC161]KZF22305.1 hypothetical protein L228DRAFT_150252 [Xylona heveae TC161]
MEEGSIYFFLRVFVFFFFFFQIILFHGCSIIVKTQEAKGRCIHLKYTLLSIMCLPHSVMARLFIPLLNVYLLVR